MAGAGAGARRERAGRVGAESLGTFLREHPRDVFRDRVVAPAGAAERLIDRRLAERVDDVDGGAVLEQILDDARPAELDRAVERGLAFALRHRARTRDARGPAM